MTSQSKPQGVRQYKHRKTEQIPLKTFTRFVPDRQVNWQILPMTQLGNFLCFLLYFKDPSDTKYKYIYIVL